MRYNKSKNTFTYYGNLQDEINKCEKQLVELEKEIDYYKWAFNNAKYNYEKRLNKIKILKDFIMLGKNKLSESEEDKEDC